MPSARELRASARASAAADAHASGTSTRRPTTFGPRQRSPVALPACPGGGVAGSPLRSAVEGCVRPAQEAARSCAPSEVGAARSRDWSDAEGDWHGIGSWAARAYARASASCICTAGSGKMPPTEPGEADEGRYVRYRPEGGAINAARWPRGACACRTASAGRPYK